MASRAKNTNPLQSLYYLASAAFHRHTRGIPLPAARRLGMRLAETALRMVPRIRAVGMANLDTAYGDTLSREEKSALLLESVRNMGIVAGEFSRTPLLDTEGKGNWFRVKGDELLDRSRGAVFMSAHLGNWEWLAGAGGSIGLRIAEIVRPFDHPKMNALVDATRQAENVRTIPKHEAVKLLMPLMREGWAAGVLADQNPRENALPAAFFGKQTWATVGPAMLAQRARVPIHPATMTRGENGVYTLEFFPALEMQNTGDILRDLIANTQRCQDAIEVMVRRTPGQWLWFHKRWKRRARLEEEWRGRCGRGDVAITEDMPC